MKKLGYFCLLAIFTLGTISCEIGLGEAVDTKAPEIEITSPATGAIIRDEFAIKGTWEDDGKIKQIDIKLRDTSSGNKNSKTIDYSATFSGNVKGEERVWQAEVNPLSSSKPVKDGKYEATITIYDLSGHRTTATRTFTIDNTPPIIVLQRPGTNSSADKLNADSYGQLLTLEGQAADDNDVDHIDVNIYQDAEKTKLLKTITLNNVPPTISLDVTKFGQDDYAYIYDNAIDTNEKTRQLYCSLVAYDGAQRYPIEGNQDASDTNGNSTNIYYLYDAYSTSAIGNYKVTELYKILSGTYENSSRAASLEEVQNILDSLETKVGTFTLNPENNPKYTVNGKSPLPESGSIIGNSEYSITKGSDVTIEIAPGLDKAAILSDGLKAYVGKISDLDVDGEIPAAKRIYFDDQEISKSGSTYKISFKLIEGIDLGVPYVFGVEAKDANGNKALPTDETGYGFILNSAGSVPEITITSVNGSEDNVVYAKKGDSVEIKGNIQLEENTAVVLKVTCGKNAKDEDIIYAQKSFIPSNGILVGKKYKYDFDVVIPVEDEDTTYFSQFVSKSYALTITAETEKIASNYRTIMYDVAGPEVNFTSILPTLTSYNGRTAPNNLEFINGKITAKGNVIDSFSGTSNIQWQLIQNNNPIGNPEVIDSVFNFEIDTTKLDDNAPVTLQVIATDKAGNSTTATKQYYIDQSTDKPTIAPNDNDTSWKCGVNNPFYINGHILDSYRTNVISKDSKLYSKVTDDDGIKNVNFKVQAISVAGYSAEGNIDNEKAETVKYNANESEWLTGDEAITHQEKLSDNVKNNTTTLNGAAEAVVTHQMPSSAGYYLITQTVTDTNNNSHEESYILKITGNAPDITVTNNTDWIKDGGEITVDITVDSGEPPYTVRRSEYKADGTTLYDSYTIAEEVNADNWTDTFAPRTSDVNRRVEYVVTDGTGSYTAKTITYKVDNDAPDTISIDAPLTGSTCVKSLNGDNYSFRGQAKDKVVTGSRSGINKLYYVFTANTVTTAPATTTFKSLDVSDGTWNINATLGTGTNNGTSIVYDSVNSAYTLYEGKYKLWVFAQDTAGNDSEIVSREFYVDQADPEITNVKHNTTALDANKTYNYSAPTDTTFALSGSITETFGVKSFKVNENTVTVANGTWSTTVNGITKDTLNTITLAVEDNAGRTKTVKYNIFNDTKKPEIEISSPAEDLTAENSISGSKYAIRGSVTDEQIDVFRYLITGTPLANEAAIISSATASTATTSGGWVDGSNMMFKKEIETQLKTGTDSTKYKEGKWYLYVYAKDAAGLESTAQRFFWIDLADPTITLDLVSQTTKNASITVKGTASDTNGLATNGTNEIVAVKIGDKISENLVVTSGKYSQTYTFGTETLPDGTYIIEVTATDISGRPKSASATITVDTKAPNGTISFNTNEYKTVDSKNWFKKEQIQTYFALNSDTQTSPIQTVVGQIFAKGSTTTEMTSALKAGTSTTTLNYDSSASKYSGYIQSSIQGEQIVAVLITDGAGNETLKTSTIYVDTLAPDTITVYESDLTEIKGARTINGSAITLYVKASDVEKDDSNVAIENSGLASVVYNYGTNGTVSATTSDKTGYYKFVIPANLNTTTYQKTGAVNFTLTDNAGNSSKIAPFSFTMDEEPPVVTPAAITDQDTSTEIIDVNGKVKISGTAVDTLGTVAKVYIKYIIQATETAPSSWTSATEIAATGTTSWSIEIDTSDKNQKYFFYKLYGEDTAGNNGESSASVNKLYINQDTDRPVIKFNTLSLADENKTDDTETRYWNKNSAIYGTVSDDDGNIKELKWSTDGSSWSSNIYSGGLWTINNLSDGTYDLYFQVKDADDTVFTSKTTSTTWTSQNSDYGPKIQDANDTEVFGYTEANNIIKIRVDTKEPKFASVKYLTQSSTATPAATAEWKDATTGIPVVGGTNKYLFIKYVVTDESGIKEAKDTFNSTAGTKVTTTEADTYISYYDISSIESGSSYKLKLEVTDKAGTKIDKDYTFEVDNSKPNIKLSSPAAGAILYATDTTNEIIGSTSDGNTVKSVKFAFSLNGTEPASTEFIDYLPESKTGYTIKLNGDSSTAEDDDHKTSTLKTYLQKLKGNISEEVYADLENTENFYIWIKAEDSLGNTETLSREIKVVPNADIPSVEFSYPEKDNATVGGTIRVNGTHAIKMESVSHVYMQIDPTYESSFNNSGWKTELETIKNNNDHKDDITWTVVSTGLDSTKYPNYQYAIDCSLGSSTWNKIINQYQEFDVSGEGSTRTIALRVFAVSSSGKISNVETRVCTIDPDAPVVGGSGENEIPVQLVQYEAGHIGDKNYITAQKAYSADMWIQGEWYIRCSVTDGSGINNLTVFQKVDGKTTNTYKAVNNNSASSSYAKKLSETGKGSASNYYDYELFFPVGTTSEGFGELTYEIFAEENSTESPKSTTYPISLKYDNTAPEFEAKSSSTGEIKATGNEIYQKAGVYTISGDFKEPASATASQSGFDKIVMFYTRTVGGSTYVVDPMLASGSTAEENYNKVETGKVVLDSTDSLYWRPATISFATGSDGSSFNVNTLSGTSVTSLTTDNKVRINGLVKVKGVMYKITDVSGKTVTVDGAISDTTITSADFAIGQVIDNLSAESKKENTTYTGLYDSSKTDKTDVTSNGDGDQMIESVTKVGTTWEWDASIVSSNILDGAIIINFAAFDKAGNEVTKSYQGTIANNSPRIAGIKYGTDENMDGTISNTEMKSTYSKVYSVLNGESENGKEGQNNKTSWVIPDTARLTVKGDMKIIPEIVNGNKGLEYQYSYDYYSDANNPGTKAGTNKTAAVSLNSNHVNGNTIREDSDTTISITLKDILKNKICEGNQNIEFTIWDKTDNSSYRDSDPHVTITLPAKFAIKDTEKPKAYFKPLYWTSNSDNSLYENSRTNGHIELEGDLPSANFNMFKPGVYDLDPKLSGKVTFDCYVTDNKIVDKIFMTVPGFNSGAAVTIATRNSSTGAWSTTGNIANGWVVTNIKDENADDGTNKVSFRLSFDTEKVSGNAATDVLFTLSAEDRGSATLSGENVTYTSNTSTNSPEQTTWGNKQSGKVYYLDSSLSQAIINDDVTVYQLAQTTYGVAKADTSRTVYYLDADLTQLPITATNSGIADNTTVYELITAQYGSVKSDANAWYLDAFCTTPVTKINISNGQTYYYLASGLYSEVSGVTCYTDTNRTIQAKDPTMVTVYYFDSTTYANKLTNGTYYTDEAKTIKAVNYGTRVYYGDKNWFGNRPNDTTNYNTANNNTCYEGQKSDQRVKMMKQDGSDTVYGPISCTLADAVENNRTFYTDVDLNRTATKESLGYVTANSTVYYVASGTYGTTLTNFAGTANKYYTNNTLTTPAIDDTLDTPDNTEVYRTIAYTYGNVKNDTTKTYYTASGDFVFIADNTPVYYAKPSIYSEVKANGKDCYFDNMLQSVVTAQPSASTTVYTFAQPTAEQDSCFYKVDIVPYITGIKRNTKYNTNRTLSGAYPLLRGEETNVISGYNLGNAANTNTVILYNSKADGSGTAYTVNTFAVKTVNKELTFTMPATSKDGYLSITVNGVSSINNINNDAKEYNKENAGKTENQYWTDTRFVRTWQSNETDYFQGSNLPIFPSMSMGTTGTLYSSFSNYSGSSVYYSTVATNANQTTTGATQVFYGYDPPEETDIYVSGEGTVNILYNANYHGGNEASWAPDTNSCGGLYLYDKNAASVYVGRNNQKVLRFELFYHNRMLQQFKNMRVIRNDSSDSGIVHVAYYDRTTQSIHYSEVASNYSYTTVNNYNTNYETYSYNEISWVNIDGASDTDDNKYHNGSSNAQYNDQIKSVTLTDNQFEDSVKRTEATGETVGLALTTNGYPVVVYYDAENSVIKVARALNTTPKGDVTKWKVQEVLNVSDPNYGTMADYIAAQIDDSGYLHIAFQNSKGELVYVKSTNTSADGSTKYTFGESETIASGVSYVDLTIRNGIPYISYITKANTFDGINIAFVDSTLDLDCDGVAEGGWETMTAPLNYKVTAVKTCVEAHPNPQNSDWEAAIGFTPGDLYRVTYYVGNGSGH